MRPFGRFSDQKETQPVTPDQIIHARRSGVFDHAAKVGVTAACAAAGISRTTYYRWVGRATASARIVDISWAGIALGWSGRRRCLGSNAARP